MADKIYEMVDLSSSNIDSAGYDAESETLRVAFRSGAIWEYYPVPESKYEGLLNAPSSGRYLNDEIKGNYTERRVE